MSAEYRHLSRSENQVRGLAQYAVDFCRGDLAAPSPGVRERTELFHLDALICGVSAIHWQTNAPTVLRREALDYADPTRWGVPCFGSVQPVAPEKAVVANCSAVREWDANGTNFGYNPSRNANRGEFGHNDFYPVAIAGAQIAGLDGRRAIDAMIALDEIRGRLAEVFALKDHKIDHVMHGGIASAAVFGALVGASAEQIESAIGMLVAHYVPFRAIRFGDQLSDSKGASAAMISEMAVLCVRRVLRGFVGPADVFRNPQALFCRFEPPAAPNESPFDLSLTTAGDDFAVMGMHFKIGLYEHQSAGAIEGLIRILEQNTQLLGDPETVHQIRIRIYEPAFGIIADRAKRNPQTRQSADHSMYYIVATLLRKAFEARQASWQDLMLLPEDYTPDSIQHPLTRKLIERIVVEHGGAEYDAAYPDGIPTSLEIELRDGRVYSSGRIVYPQGHARNESGRLQQLLQIKFARLAAGAVGDVNAFSERFRDLASKSSDQIRRLYEFAITTRSE